MTLLVRFLSNPPVIFLFYILFQVIPQWLEVPLFLYSPSVLLLSIQSTPLQLMKLIKTLRQMKNNFLFGIDVSLIQDFPESKPHHARMFLLLDNMRILTKLL